MSAVATAAAATATCGAPRSPTSAPPTSPSGHDDRAAAVARALGLLDRHRRPRRDAPSDGRGRRRRHDDPHRPQRRGPVARRRRRGGRRTAHGGAQRATDAERPLLDALFADAALEAGTRREAMETARRVVAATAGGAARNLAEALLVLGGRAAPGDLGPLEPESATTIARDRAVAGDRPPGGGPPALR